MSWFLLLTAVAFGAWKLTYRPIQPRKKRPESKKNDPQREVVNLSDGVTLTIEVTGGDSTFTPEEAVEYAKRMTAADERERNAIPWSTDTSIQLPIKALTGYQSLCLREARLRYQIVMKNIDMIENVSLNDLREWPKRTIDSLVKHGLLELGDSGAYRITDIGLRALETLPTK